MAGVTTLAAAGLGVGSYFVLKEITAKPKSETLASQSEKPPPSKATPLSSPTPSPQSYPYTLVAHKGEVFGAKVPKG